MKTSDLLEEISRWESADEIRSLLKLNDPRLRKLDCGFATSVLHWTEFRTNENNEYVGKDEDGVERVIPCFSFREPIMRLVVKTLLAENPFLKIMELPSDWHDDWIFFYWKVFLAPPRNYSRLGSAHAATAAEAICVSTTEFFSLMGNFDNWFFAQKQWKNREKKLGKTLFSQRK